MGYPNNSHIKKFVKGQVIEDIQETEDGVWLSFQSGEKLKLTLVSHLSPVVISREVVAIPFKKDGEVKQSTEIESGT